MIDKRDIINYVFVASFPVYGIGAYISASISPSLGYLSSIIPHLIIILFYVVDLLYRGEFRIRVNGLYLLMVIFLISSAVSLFIAFFKHLPETTQLLTIMKSFQVIIPFQAFVVVQLYNERSEILVRLTFISLSILLFINLIGFFVFGMSNEVHSIEGRINFPFIDGLYSGSSLMAIIILMLVYYFKFVKTDVVKFIAWMGYLLLNIMLLFLTNSRLVIMILLVVMVLLLLQVISRSKSVYWISLFTVPILLNTGLLIYYILTLPVFASVLQRVDLIDVTTFNGRAFLWKDAIDWLLFDQRGILFGNGYRGHYFFGLISDVASMWNEKQLHHLHLHSTSLEILVGQGIVVYIIFLILFYRLFKYYQVAYSQHDEQGVFLAVVVYMLFIMQVDTFLYMESLGMVIFSWLLAPVMITKNA